MIDYRIKLKFITPMFGHGALARPEVRAASIRGQLHSWFRMLGGTALQEREVFGGIKQKAFDNRTLASRIAVCAFETSASAQQFKTLPHKAQDSSREAFRPGSECEIFITERLGGIKDAKAKEIFAKSVKAWLLMGALGFRSTRGGGNFTWEWEEFPMPGDPQAYDDECQEVLDGTEIRSAILGKEYNDAETVRRILTDSLGGRQQPGDGNELQRLNNPLGGINVSRDQRRKTSPMKYRAVRFGNAYRILAVWDGRREATGNKADDLYGLVELLRKRKPELGEQLARSRLA